MPTAKEMFETLGYEYMFCSDINRISYSRYDGCGDFQLIFFDVDYRIFFTEDEYEGMHIDIPTFKAIHQQMKELGWLDE